MTTKKSDATKPKSKLLLQVTDNLKVQIFTDKEHEFLMTTKEVALGYGTTDYNIRRHKLEHSTELIEGKHYKSNVSIPHAAQKGSSRGTLWTKRGIIRLGFFIKTDKAQMFRDWAEDLVVNEIEKGKQLALFDGASSPKRKHNRLSQERLVSILTDIAQIDNKDLRLSLISKLGVS
jgi:hypothetical protein